MCAGAADERAAGGSWGQDQEVEDQEPVAQETLAEVQDILTGAYEDAQTILGGEEGAG